MRLLALWLVLFGVYAATLPTDTVRGARYAGDEPHHLLAAESLVADRDVDLTDQYAQRAYASFAPAGLDPVGTPTLGRLHEPYAVGLALAIAPAVALSGPSLAALALAAAAALGFVLAAALARRLVPEPWASGGVLVAGLSPPAIAAATAISPEALAGTLLAGAALLALATRDDPRQRHAYGAALALAALPWLGTGYVIAGAPIAFVLVRWTLAARRRFVALVSAEAIFASLVMFFTLNERLYGGPTPSAAGGQGTGASSAAEYVERLPRLASVWIDRDVGLLRWAPLLALAFVAAWLLWRSHSAHLSRAIPARRDAEVAAGLLLAVCGAQVLVAVLGSPALAGPWFPGRQLVPMLPCAAALAAWGLRRVPRLGVALAALTLLASGWLLAALWTGELAGWAEPTAIPWGPLVAAFPRYGAGGVWPDVATAALAAALAVLVAREWLGRRALRHEAARGLQAQGR